MVELGEGPPQLLRGGSTRRGAPGWLGTIPSPSFLGRDGVMRCLGGDLAGHADGFGHRRLGMSELVYLLTCGPHDRPAALLRWSVAQRGEEKRWPSC